MDIMSLLRVSSAVCTSLLHKPTLRAFSTLPPLLEKALPPRPVIPESDIEEAFIHGSGPGGQKINKTASAVQLKHLPTGIVVKCQETRSRPQNRKLARMALAERLDEMEKGPNSRTAIKNERMRKKKASATKKSRRKYRKLEEGGPGESGKVEGEVGGSGHGAKDDAARIETGKEKPIEAGAQKDARLQNGPG